jgi:hypothetical protein
MHPDEMEQKLSEIEGTIQKIRSALEKQFQHAHQTQPMTAPDQIQRVQLGLKLEALRDAAKEAKAAADKLLSLG